MKRNKFKNILPAALFILLCLWSTFYPEYIFSDETVIVKDNEGNILSEDERKKLGNLFLKLCEADKDHIKVKSKLLEWLGVEE